MSNNSKWLIGGIAGALLLCVCIGLVVLTAGGLALIRWDRAEGQDIVDVSPPVETRAPVMVESTPTAQLLETLPVSREGAAETLETLENEIVPINDPRELAMRLEGKQNIPETLTDLPPDLEVGAQETFWVTNVDTSNKFQVTATLRYETPHLYFWIENGVDFSQSDVKRLAETFENDIYPTNRNFFGSEWTPGVDNDPHLNVLYGKGMGRSVGGYFSSSDAYHPDASQYSNMREMFMLSADNVPLRGNVLAGIMAHEFQHMIHWYRDRNEEGWVNEGFSELAQFLNGYDPGRTVDLFIQDPDLQLNNWPSSPASIPHYGSSFLFFAYFLDRFGNEATQAVVAHPDNGMDSIDAVLASIGATDPQTNQIVQADDVFADWVLTNYLNREDVGGGRYAYQGFSRAPQVSPTEEISSCASDWETRTVQQYGADYIALSCSGNFTLHFEGGKEVGVLPVNAYSGSYAFWSNRGDESDMTLTRTFDFSSAIGPLTLTYHTWYDLEEDYDYLYLTASEDGENWQILQTPSGTSEDPSGNSYGWGYNGKSNGWIEESVDLSPFAGKKVTLRFEYVTDAQVNGDGFFLDDVRVQQTGYEEDFEEGADGWEAEGFVRIQNRLPQLFRVALVREGKTLAVETIALSKDQTAQVSLPFGPEMRNAVLVVSGVTRYTTQPAVYRFRFSK